MFLMRLFSVEGLAIVGAEVDDFLVICTTFHSFNEY